ncbi:hypothetical protein IFM89_018309, partial [Coptis chinensis]
LSPTTRKSSILKKKYYKIGTLICDFATEKSQGERRVAGLKKRIEELRSTLDLTNEHLEEAKGLKESAEQELKGFEVELSLNDSSILAQQVLFSPNLFFQFLYGMFAEFLFFVTH